LRMKVPFVESQNLRWFCLSYGLTIAVVTGL
jgi:hypothetical protein